MQVTEIGLRNRQPFVGRFAVPIGSLRVVLRHAVAVFIQCANIILGLGKILGGRLAVPRQGLRVVARNRESPGIKVADRSLGRRIALVGGLAIPAQRLGIILPDTLALFIHHPQVVLGLGIVPGSLTRQLALRHRILALGIGSGAGLIISPRRQRSGQASQ